MRKPQTFAALVVLFFSLAVTWAYSNGHRVGAPAPCVRVDLPVVVNLDDVKHVHLIDHERNALNGVAVGELSPHAVTPAPRTLTLERDGASVRRTEDLRGIPTMSGFDRDEYPPALAAESGLHSDGTRASVAYVFSAENRSGGSVLGRQLAPYCDGQRFIIEAGKP